MRVRLIYPRFERFLEAYPELVDVPSIAGLWKYKMPPALGVPMLASMMPPDVEWGATDANVEPVDYDEPVDLVAISFFTPQAASAYEIARGFRERGVKVVMGGMHPSMHPEDAARHCDALCVGEAEGAWPEILADAAAGRLRPRYTPAPLPPERWARPLRSLFSRYDPYDWAAALVQVARGCPRACPYCNLPELQGRDLRLRPIDAVVDEVVELGSRDLYLTEDVIMFKAASVSRYTTELFERLRSHEPSIFLTSSFVFNARPAFLETLRAGGTQCLYVTLGFDPISRGLYRGDARYTAAAREIVERIQGHGIRFYGAFGVGFDEDDPGVFDRILRFCDDAGVVTAEFFLATPFPGTPLWYRLRAEGRLLHEDFGRYNCAHVVFEPKQMSAEELREGFLYLWKEFYRGADVDEALGCFRTRGRPRVDHRFGSGMGPS